jgi:hypothetical protein
MGTPRPRPSFPPPSSRGRPVRFPNESAEYRAARTALLVPLWNVLDTTSEGRGTDWYPKLQYGA